ncbi:alpha/beta hydrolase [Streptomyces sviceus]|uniref:alpha/beta hydrolase n=1 Tax=Streptomyces sviceus TaxID=285530 RepID=UPI0038054E9F
MVVLQAAPSAQTSPGRIAWTPCEPPSGKSDSATFECATIKVPVNWKRPHGATIDLALTRLLATDPAHRIGSLLINPGGPGGSGVDFAFQAPAAFSPELRARFDIVGFDPRGIGRSNPVTCDQDLLNAQWNAIHPDSSSNFAALRKANHALGENCRRLTGPLVGHMDTASVVRDMDAIRSGLGEQRISYYGVSYGTLIGQQYAELYPSRIRAMTLDSNMDHSLGPWSYQKTETVAAEESYGQFADWCARTPSCAIHDRDARALFDSLYKRAEAGDLVLPGDPPQKATTVDLQELVVRNMYTPSSWFDFAQRLKDIDAAAPAAARAVGKHGDPTPFAYYSVLCQDFDFNLPSYATLARHERALARLAPVTRLSSIGWNDVVGCQNWPTKVTNPQRGLQVEGTPKLLVTNSRYDVATPYPWGVNVARQLGSEAAFLTYDGVGHGDYWRSPCARDAIDTYLVTLQAPRTGTHCPAVWPTEPTAQRKSLTGDLVDPLPGLLGTGTHR